MKAPSSTSAGREGARRTSGACARGRPGSSFLALVALVLLWTTYCQVEPEEVGVVQRFGAYVRTTEPGPHLKLPLGIERVTKVPVQRQGRPSR